MRQGALLFAFLQLSCSVAIAEESPKPSRPPLEITWDDQKLDRERPLPSSFSKIAKEATPSVVRLSIARDETWWKERREKIPTLFLDPEMEEVPQTRSFGSGIVIDGAGVILTNAHVVDKVETCEIYIGESRVAIRGNVLAQDLESDLALVKIETRQELVPAVFTKDKPEIGDFVLALGNPQGVGMTLTKGIISATNRSRSWKRGNPKGEFLQIDAAILPGNSGGALLDLEGRVIGINSWYLPQGHGNIGFAFPGERAVKIAQDLWQYGHVRYGYLGVRLGGLDAERLKELELPEKTTGVVILSVEMDLAGDQCGLRVGDVVTKVDDFIVRDVSGFANQLKLREVGSSMNLHVIRGGVSKTLTATLGMRPVPQVPKK